MCVFSSIWFPDYIRIESTFVDIDLAAFNAFLPLYILNLQKILQPKTNLNPKPEKQPKTTLQKREGGYYLQLK
jgi:hypothetical protein